MPHSFGCSFDWNVHLSMSDLSRRRKAYVLCVWCCVYKTTLMRSYYSWRKKNTFIFGHYRHHYQSSHRNKWQTSRSSWTIRTLVPVSQWLWLWLRHGIFELLQYCSWALTACDWLPSHHISREALCELYVVYAIEQQQESTCRRVFGTLSWPKIAGDKFHETRKTMTMAVATKKGRKIGWVGSASALLPSPSLRIYHIVYAQWKWRTMYSEHATEEKSQNVDLVPVK